MNHSITHRTMEEIEQDMLDLMSLIEQERQDFHDRCSEHSCQGCAP
jgi:hypothetical protein